MLIYINKPLKDNMPYYKKAYQKALFRKKPTKKHFLEKSLPKSTF